MKNRPDQTRREFLRKGITGGGVLAALPLTRLPAAYSYPQVETGGPPNDSRDRLLEMVRTYGGEFGSVGKEN